MAALKELLTWYLNRYSNGWNQHCDICWAGYIAFTHFLYGALDPLAALAVLGVTQLIKHFVPTDHDKQAANW